MDPTVIEIDLVFEVAEIADFFIDSPLRPEL
jgi:hypothetical protein